MIVFYVSTQDWAIWIRIAKFYEEFLNQMISVNLIFNKKKDQGLNSFYKTTDKDDEIPLDLPI